MVIIMSSFLSRCTGNDREQKRFKEKHLSADKPQMTYELRNEKMYLIQGNILFPEYINRDLTADYVNLYPLNNYNRENLKIIIEEYDQIIDKSVSDSLMFNFEKRNK